MPPADRRILLLTDPAMDLHSAPGHPERPERLAAVAEGVADAANASGATLLREMPPRADDDALHRIHPPWHVDRLEEIAVAGGGWLDADTYLSRHSMDAARLAAGATIRAAVAAASGEVAVAFAVVRPPGHHASEDRPGGFCLVNNVALAAAALREQGIAQRVAILDWDVHHGDGTQAIFDADADLLYASTHQSPLYPGTGEAAERGMGAAEGTMHNVPLPPGAGDREFTSAWLDLLLPAVERFRPGAILVSAGYDAHRADPLAHLEVSEAGYGAVARAIGALAARLGIAGVALTLEGGYDLPALRASAAATVAGLLEGLDEKVASTA
ncbi:MAG TPA: histone deacetylase [Candidatus Limnocylindrales bacterium]|nr:histone deacetylase [Candidatus Limnocylindrales bacterium]